MTASKTPLFLLLLALVAPLGAACGGGGGSGGGGSTTGTGGTTAAAACFDYTGWDGAAPAVSFKTDVLPLLRASCGLSASCHGSEAGPGGQHYYGASLSAGDLTADQIQKIFDQSVGVAAAANPAQKVVDPSHPEASFLMYKLDGDPAKSQKPLCADLACSADDSCGTSMPQGGPILPEDKRDTIRRWIAQGAKND
jgi:hypothetical protein